MRPLYVLDVHNIHPYDIVHTGPVFIKALGLSRINSQSMKKYTHVNVSFTHVPMGIVLNAQVGY